MWLIDFTIIYLACGAPISVEYVLQFRSPLSLATISYTVLRLLIWPIFAIDLIRQKLLSLKFGSDSRSVIAHELGLIRTHLESILSFRSTTTQIFEYRELFDRYTGLNIEAAALAIDTGVSELLMLEGHPNTGLAKICIERRNRDKISRHRGIATQQFYQLVDSQSPVHRISIYESASNAAALVGDTATVKYFTPSDSITTSSSLLRSNARISVGQ